MANLYTPIPANQTHFPNPYFVSLLSIVLGQSDYFRQKPMNEYVHTRDFSTFVSFVSSDTTTSPEITDGEKKAVKAIYHAAFGNGASADDAARMLDSLPHGNLMCKVMIAHITVIGIAVLFVAMRFYSRLRVLTGPKREDWLILLALICFVASSVISFMGVGPAYRHIYDVSGKVLSIWFRMGVIVFYPMIIGMCLVKLSFLEIYRTMAPSERFVRICWAVAILLLVGSVAFLIALSLICYPTHIAWTEPLNKKCSDRRLQLNTALSVFYVLTDFLILALPITIVWNAKMPLKTKIGVVVMFALGTSACIFSILRSVFSSNTDVDFTWHSIPTLIFGMLEMYIGVICACLPATRNIFVSSASRIRRRLSHTTYSSSRRGSRSKNTRSAIRSSESQIRGILKSTSMGANNPKIEADMRRGGGYEGWPGNVILGGMLLTQDLGADTTGCDSKPGNESSELEEIREEPKKPESVVIVNNGGLCRYDDYEEDEIVIGGDLGDSYRHTLRAIDAGFTFGGSSSVTDLEKGGRS